MSRRHARIVADGGRFTLEDLDSKNGAYLRDQRLKPSAALEDGDTIRLGGTLLVFRVSPRVGTTILRTERPACIFWARRPRRNRAFTTTATRWR